MCVDEKYRSEGTISVDYGRKSSEEMNKTLLGLMEFVVVYTRIWVFLKKDVDSS